MYVNHVAMNMIRLSEILTTESNLEQLLKICRKTGYVQSVDSVKMYLPLKINLLPAGGRNLRFQSLYDLQSE